MAALIPPRAPDTPACLIDLSPHYNAPLTTTWHTEAYDHARGRTNDLSSLPQGIQRLGGVAFDVRGVVQLAIRDWPGRYPTNVCGIRVGLACQRLHFLHSTGWYATNGVTIGRYIVHYADGRRREIPICYGEDVLDWWMMDAERKQAPHRAVTAWQGPNTATAARGLEVRLFRSTWENPEPETPIATLDFETTLTYAAPFLVAITADSANASETK